MTCHSSSVTSHSLLITLLLTFAHQFINQTYRQAYDVPVVAFNAFDEESGLGLNSVCSGFVQRITFLNQKIDLVLAHRRKLYTRALKPDLHAPVSRDHDPRQNLVPVS